MGSYKRVLIALAAVVVVLIAAGTVVTIKSQRGYLDGVSWIGHSQEILAMSKEVYTSFRDAQLELDRFLIGGDSLAISNWNALGRRACEFADSLPQLTADNEQQRHRSELISAELVEFLKDGSAILELSQHNGLSNGDGLTLFHNWSRRGSDLTRSIEELRKTEFGLLAERRVKAENAIKWFVLAFATAVFLSFSLIALLYFIVKSNRSLESTVLARDSELADYRYALDESSIMAITDQTGIIRKVNQNFCSISGYSAEELIGNDHRLVNSGYHPKSFFVDLWKTISSGRIWRGEIRNRAKDGHFYWVDTTIVPFRNEKGIPYQYVAIRNDISSRKAEEQKREALEIRLQEKGRELESMFERITDGFIALDSRYHYVFANKRIGEMTHRDPAMLIGKYVWDVFPEAKGSKTHLAFEQAMTEQRYVYNLDYYAPLDLWQENHIYPSADGLSIFVRDVSERKRAEIEAQRKEEIYRSIAGNIPGSLITLADKDFSFILIEGDMMGSLGFTSEMEGTDIRRSSAFGALCPPDVLRNALAGEAQLHETYVSGIDIQVRIAPIRDASDMIYAVLLVGFDVTALKAAHRSIAELNADLEEKVQLRTRQLEIANGELEAFSYSVSHDLRAPLRAIDGFARMIDEDYHQALDQEGRRLLGVVSANAKRMGVLIDDLLSFSRLGKKEPVCVPVDMNAMVREVFKELLPDSEHNISVQMNELAPVYGDPNLLRQVWTNLLSNAVKYSARKSNPIIEVGSFEDQSDWVYFVKDNGAGFDQQYADKLFGVFQRLHAEEEFEGTGVGLALTKRIVSKHGGRVWAYGKLEMGAEFYFSLPAHTI